MPLILGADAHGHATKDDLGSYRRHGKVLIAAIRRLVLFFVVLD